MKKKFFGTLLLGCALVASLGFTSCKDYDDDINDLRNQIEANSSALTAAKTSLETQIASMKTELENKDAELTSLISQLQTATSTNKTSIENEIVRAKAAEAALEARIATAESAISDIKTLLAQKVDQSEYDAEVTRIYAKIEAVQTDLAAQLQQSVTTLQNGLNDEALARAAADADLQQQIDALKAFKEAIEAADFQTQINNLSATLTEKVNNLQSQIDALVTDLNTLKDKVDMNTEDITKLQNKLAELQESVTTNTKNIADLRTELNNAVSRISALEDEVVVLNVLIKTSLRSLVFVPESYYWGIEATRILVMNYFKYDLPATAWNVKETRGYTEASLNIEDAGVARTSHARYDSTAAARILTFVAQYHMNPSSADEKQFTEVKVLDDDKAYVNTRASEASLSVKDWYVQNGLLNVNLNVSNPDKIKSVLNDQAVTVFATQVTVATGTQDTTITSDYATLYKDEISDIKLAHTQKGDVAIGNGTSFTGVENTHCGQCTYTANKNHLHLMATVAEAAAFEPQDIVYYDGTLDLSQLVETHYTNAAGKHEVMSATDLAANGLSYKFDLTALYLGGNETSESAHAAIQGNTLRPQMPEYDENHVGLQQAYGATQDRQEIGRTPVVRVSLVDEAGNVLDYGYIRIKITEKGKETPEGILPETAEYTGPDWTYNWECEVPGYEDATKWIQTEYDIYNKLGITRDEFRAHYTAVGGDADMTQYTTTDKKTFTKLTTKVGLVSNVPDPEAGTIGTNTNILKWVLTSAQAKKLFITEKKTAAEVWVKFESDDVTKAIYNDVYVGFKTGTVSIGARPTAEVAWDNVKNRNYWYTTNLTEINTTMDEIHTNVIPVEDNVGGTASAFDNTFSDVFVGNKIVASQLITNLVDNTPGGSEGKGEYATGKLTLDLVFDQSNVGKVFKGESGATYKMSISTNGKILYATKQGTTLIENVASIEYKPADGVLVKDIDHQAVFLNQTDFAKDLLNYVAHDELNNDALIATIGLTAKNECEMPLTLTNNTFDVRFLRPLNVASADKSIEDASVEELQTIKLADLVKFTDWRDAWKGADQDPGGEYWNYYVVTGITIDGVNDGEKISRNADVLTDQNQTEEGKFVELQSVNGAVDFTYYSADGGYLVYKNLSSTVKTFTVKIPVTVEYIWGKIHTVAVVTIDRTHANAKQN